MTETIITAHQGRSTWQGHTADAPEWVLRALDAVSGGTDTQDAARPPSGQEIEASGEGVTRGEICAEAARIITKDRAATHGDAERNFGRIAAYWSAHLDHAISATDVAAMMALLKLARIAGNPAHLDSWVDGVGYMACGGEIAAAQQATHHAVPSCDSHRRPLVQPWDCRFWRGPK